MRNKPKIAVIGLKGLPAFGGAAAVGENIIEQLRDKYDFTVYSVSSHTDLKTGEYNGYKQIVFKQKKRSGLNTLIYYSKSVFHCLFIKKYDIIHLHHNAVTFFIPFLRLRSKLVLTTHGIHTESKFNKLKWFFKLADYWFDETYLTASPTVVNFSASSSGISAPNSSSRAITSST